MGITHVHERESESAPAPKAPGLRRAIGQSSSERFLRAHAEKSAGMAVEPKQ